MKRIRHKDIANAVERLNKRRGLEYGDKGYLIYCDIRGDGTYRPGFYIAIRLGKSSGMVNVSNCYKGRTMRETLAKVESML